MTTVRGLGFSPDRLRTRGRLRMAASFIFFAISFGSFHAPPILGMLGLGEFMVGLATPRLLNSSSPASKRASRDAVSIEDIPSGIVGAVPVTPKATKFPIADDSVGRREAGLFDRLAEAVSDNGRHWSPSSSCNSRSAA